MNPIQPPFPLRLRRFAACLTLLALSSTVVVHPAEAASRPPVRGEKGMVVCADPLASEVGVEILKKGGNAVDAAVAVGFALAVVHPAAGNLGGGGFLVAHLAGEGKELSLDFRETAPKAASRDMYLDGEGNFVEERSTVGHLASGTPGSVAGLHAAWERFGTLPWSDLVEPSVRLARDGFKVSRPLSLSLENSQELLSRFRETRRIFLRNGRFYREGETFRQPELARTLERIAGEGPRGFYEGEVARLIVREMEANGGILRLDDLRDYRPRFREPVRGTYRDYEVVSMGPPSSGGIVLIQMLNMMEGFPVSNFGFGSSRLLHLMAEVMRRAFADRAEFMGDPDFVRIPVAGLLDREYARKRASDIRAGLASTSDTVGHGNPWTHEPEETTHFSVVDAQGNAVAVTTTLNGSYGSGVAVPGAGFLMNNEMDDFTAKPGAPNMFGLIQGEANAIEPGKRPLSAMTPTLLLKKGRPFLVTGSPGGPTIINTVFQVILNVVDHGLDIQRAVDAPRIHHQWMPDRIVTEEHGLVPDQEWALRSKGHELDYRTSIGDAHSILIDPETGVRLGAADPRREQGQALGY